MARERIQTRADADTLEQVEQYAEDKDISYSEAVRRLVRTGLIEKGYREAEAGGDELAEARMNETVRTTGGALIGLMVLLLLLLELGML
jgi:transposase